MDPKDMDVPQLTRLLADLYKKAESIKKLLREKVNEPFKPRSK